MAHHGQLDFANLGPGPIDIAAAADVLRNSQFMPESTPDTEHGAYEDLGGIARLPFDERTRYLPYADILAQDARKIDVSRGLGGLGLLVASPTDVDNFRGARQLDYAAASIRYEKQLATQQKLLRTPGQYDGPDSRYPNTDPQWAGEYAEQLNGLHRTFTHSAVYDSIQRIVRNEGDKVWRRVHHVPSPHVEVQLSAKGKLLVVTGVRSAKPRAA